jgi:hypothetical protein
MALIDDLVTFLRKVSLEHCLLTHLRHTWAKRFATLCPDSQQWEEHVWRITGFPDHWHRNSSTAVCAVMLAYDIMTPSGLFTSELRTRLLQGYGYTW